MLKSIQYLKKNTQAFSKFSVFQKFASKQHHVMLSSDSQSFCKQSKHKNLILFTKFVQIYYYYYHRSLNIHLF